MIDEEIKLEKTDYAELYYESLTDYKDLYLRTLADFDNYRKRTDANKEKDKLGIIRKTILQILPIYDNLFLLKKVSNDETMNNGVQMIIDGFVRDLDKLEIELVPTEDYIFNPEYHEAVGIVPAETEEDIDVVAEVVQEGFIFKSGELIRASKVKVFKEV